MKERCIVCGTETGIDKNTPVNERELYISGIGQLCYKCHVETTDPEMAKRQRVNEEIRERICQYQQR
ncbi:MAG: hypothetical protein ISS36_03820 [Candidatus Aenigmarchaeota archaeon]|nr:hypothetical protein [Candidatus Aenigmarchaeota archaeon]